MQISANYRLYLAAVVRFCMNSAYVGSEVLAVMKIVFNNTKPLQRFYHRLNKDTSRILFYYQDKHPYFQDKPLWEPAIYYETILRQFLLIEAFALK